MALFQRLFFAVLLAGLISGAAMAARIQAWDNYLYQQSLLGKGLVDELVLYLAPTLLGSNARALFTLPIEQMAQQVQLTINDIRAIGPDWRIRATPAR